MPDDYKGLPDNPQADDDDVPFKLPNNDDGNIHKEDTEDIIFPEGGFDQDTVEHGSPEDIARLHASDPPLEQVEDNVDSVAFTAPQDIHKGDTEDLIIPEGGFDQQTVAHYKSDLERHDEDDDQYTNDNDVPFKVPKNAPQNEGKSSISNEWVTMPHERETLAGTDGLDPNPDFVQEQRKSDLTVQNRVVPQQDNLSQADALRYSRPQYTPSQPAPISTGTPPPAPPAQVPVGQKQRPLPRRRKRRFNPGCLAIFIGLFVTFCGGLTLITGISGVVAYVRVEELLDERVQVLDDYSNFQSTFFYDRNNVQLFELFGEGRRTNVSLDDMPDYLINATIAIEDDSFYSNMGIDIGATTVALLQFLGAEQDEQTAGGSTITQQLVRNVLFDFEYRSERSAQRKAEEILLAIALTQRRSKDDILELYLNEIYYGNLAYGAEAASQVLFGKSVSELTLGEAALLAGLPQAPAELDPLSPDPEVQAAVQVRWRAVLNEMVEEGYITEGERDQALRQGLTFDPQDVPLRAPHFTVYAQEQTVELLTNLGYSPEAIVQGGWDIYTTVDVRINDYAQQVAAQQVASLQANNISNAAVVIVSPLTGEILAMVGSIDYNNDAIDGRFNVVTGLRQPGSTMKPFTYALALEQGMTAGDVIWDTRTNIGIPGQPAYIPRNYDGTFHGPLSMRMALANSYNIPAVQTLRQVGVQNLLDFLTRFGVTSLGQDASVYGLSLTLGGGEISPLELTTAYSVFANQGVYVPSTAIRCIIDNNDNIIYQYENGCPRGNLTGDTTVEGGFGTQALDRRVAFLISDILADNQARSRAMGSNSNLYTPNIFTSVKTGTTNDVKDNWTVGFTSNVAIGVWVGNNNGDPMINSSGLTGAAPIWNQVMTAIYSNNEWLAEFTVDGQLQTDQLTPPPNMTLSRICNVERLADPATNCASFINEWLLDSPAGIPDGGGGFIYPPANNQQTNIPSAGPFVQEISPGVLRTVVFRLNPALAAGIQFTLQAGEQAPPPPLYCQVPVEAISSTPGVVEQVFLAPPPVQADAAEAEQWARSHNLAFLPTIACTPELIAGGSGGADFVTAIITSPTPNQVVNDVTAILGTVDLSPEQAVYYRIDVIGGQFGQWTPLGDVHYNSVINGELETLYTPALDSGSYRLRVVVVGNNGNDLQAPYEVPFTVP